MPFLYSHVLFNFLNLSDGKTKNQLSNNRCFRFHTVTQDSLKDTVYD